MKQASLKLKMGLQNINIMSSNIGFEKILLNTILSVFVALALWYVIILGNMVLNITQRKTLEKEMLTLSNEVGNLELSYLSISGKVDLALSSAMGFKEAHATFATRKSLGSLKIVNNEI